jgi:hypothetical protein
MTNNIHAFMGNANNLDAPFCNGFCGLPNGEFTLEFNFVDANSIIGYFNSKKRIQTGEISLIELEI